MLKEIDGVWASTSMLLLCSGRKEDLCQLMESLAVFEYVYMSLISLKFLVG